MNLICEIGAKMIYYKIEAMQTSIPTKYLITVVAA